jgi:hypothetical protein
VALRLLGQMSMPSDAEEYRGYTIHWDTISPGDGPWNAKAGITSPPDTSGFCRIISITGSRFESEAEARDYIRREAKKRVDELVNAA